METIMTNDRACNLNGEVFFGFELTRTFTEGLKRQFWRRNNLDFDISIKGQRQGIKAWTEVCR